MEKNLSENKRENAIILRICKHVKFQKNKILPEIYVDGYGHCIASETDYHYIQKYPRSYEQFKRKYENMLKDRMGCRR